MEYSRKEIERILQCSYYDHRTDYIWNYILGGEIDFDLVKYPIPDLESFQAMHDMLRRRKLTVDQFLTEVKADSPTYIKECHYVKRSKRLSLMTRSYQFSYDEKKNRYHFIVYPNIAKSIGLIQGETTKHYKKPGMFPLSYLVELDKQLFERHEENEKVRHWIKTEQFSEDKEFCSAMIPYIMQDAANWQIYLGGNKRLNIVLRGNDKVCIGTVQDYSPEEMMSMPCYPRTEWKKGIDQALTSQKVTMFAARNRKQIDKFGRTLSGALRPCR